MSTTTGKEGEVNISWYDTGGGACGNGYEKINLHNLEVSVCHHFSSDENGASIESWGGIQVLVNKNPGLLVYINANSYADKPEYRETVLQVLRSIIINKVDN